MVVKRLDVVAALPSHQQNLTPDAVLPRAALVALPPPILASLVAPEWFMRVRAGRLETLAAELGGGDGPLAIETLADPAASLARRLVRLRDGGVRRVILDGARDRPGHARALRYRWGDELEVLPGSLLDDLMTLTESIRMLGSDVVRTAPGAPIPATARLVFAAVEPDGDPRRVRDHGAHVWPYAIDRERQLGSWAGVVPPEALFGTERAAEIRARWDAYWSTHGDASVVRSAVLGLEPDLEADLRDAAPDSPVERRAALIAITGIDGSGKSTHVAHLAAHLRDRGARVRVLKLYRQGAFLELANQLGARTRRGAPLAAFRVSRIVKLVDSLRVLRDHLAPALASCDAVIMDRYVETHVAAAEAQLGWDLARHPALAPYPTADLRYWLALDPDVALARRDARAEPASADEHAVGLAGYATVFARLAAAAGESVLDANASEADNAAAIAARAAALVTTTTHPSEPSALVPPAAVGRIATSAPCRVVIGIEDARPALGDEVFALHEDLARWCGPRASGVPESFWLEAYAAQLVLDAITRDLATASIALWPGALVRMSGHEDLPMLRELERMLEPLVVIERVDLRPDSCRAAFEALGATSIAASRLAADYTAALAVIARERGWTSAAAPSAPVS